MATVETLLTSNQVRQIIAAFVAGLGGVDPALNELTHGIKLRVGMVVLGLVQEAFIEKARGGQGEDGIKWKPLKPATIAARRIGPGDRNLLKGIKDKGGSRPYLTSVQDQRWRMIFATRKAWFQTKFGMDPGAASARAAAIAWTIIKDEGGLTKLGVLGGRSVEIGRDTGRLFRSLSPGVPDPPSHPITTEPPDVPERILREEPGKVAIGSKVEYAPAFHAQRPLWPPNGALPTVWAGEIARATATGVRDALVLVLERRG